MRQDPTRSETPSEHGGTSRGNREIPRLATGMAPWSALKTAMGNAAMYGRGKSDGPILPRKRPNKDGGAPPKAEAVEGRGSAKGNAVEQTRFRTQRREDLQRELDRVRHSQQHRHSPSLAASARLTRGRSPLR